MILSLGLVVLVILPGFIMMPTSRTRAFDTGRTFVSPTPSTTSSFRNFDRRDFRPRSSVDLDVDVDVDLDLDVRVGGGSSFRSPRDFSHHIPFAPALPEFIPGMPTPPGFGRFDPLREPWKFLFPFNTPWDANSAW